MDRLVQFIIVRLPFLEIVVYVFVRFHDFSFSAGNFALDGLTISSIVTSP